MGDRSLKGRTAVRGMVVTSSGGNGQRGGGGWATRRCCQAIAAQQYDRCYPLRRGWGGVGVRSPCVPALWAPVRALENLGEKVLWSDPGMGAPTR